MSRILIKNGRIWNGETFVCGDVLTEGKQIRKLGRQITEQADFIYDAAGKIVSPGLVDIHVHMKGCASNSIGMQAEMASFPFGVTSTNDAGSLRGDEVLLESFAVKTTVFVCTKIKNNHAQFDFTEQLLRAYGKKAIGVKVYFDAKISEVVDITPLREICEYARARSLKVMVHCSHSPSSMLEIVQELSEGDILTHVFHGGVNTCEHNAFEVFDVARAKGIILDAGFAGDVHTNFGVLERAVKAGYLPDTISTDITSDSAYKCGGKYGMTMCMSFARTMGMSEEDIFKKVTTVPAKALGKEKEWGSLQVGKTADIAVFDYTDEVFDLTDKEGNRLKDDYGYRCVLTVSDGIIVYRY